MNETIVLSPAARGIAGILLLTIVAVEWGGLHMLRLVRGTVPATDFQRAFARAGHAHAGVLVVFSLVVQILADGAAMTGFVETVARNAVPLAAILMPAGFFFSSAGRGRTQPNRLVALVYVGAASLAAGVITLGLGLLLG